MSDSTPKDIKRSNKQWYQSAWKRRNQMLGGPAGKKPEFSKKK